MASNGSAGPIASLTRHLECFPAESVRCWAFKSGWVPGRSGAGCTTYKWKLSRPALLPIIFKLAIQMAASESQNCINSSNNPEHS